MLLHREALRSEASCTRSCVGAVVVVLSAVCVDDLMHFGSQNVT